MGVSKFVEITATKINGSEGSFLRGLNWNKIVLAIQAEADVVRIYYDADSKADLDQYLIAGTVADFEAVIDLVDANNSLIAVTLFELNGIPFDGDALINTTYTSYASLIETDQLPAGQITGTRVHYDKQNRRYLNNKVLRVVEDLITRP